MPPARVGARAAARRFRAARPDCDPRGGRAASCRVVDRPAARKSSARSRATTTPSTSPARRAACALCLTKLAEVPHAAVNATLAPGAIVRSQLTMRVLRLLDPRRNTSTGLPAPCSDRWLAPWQSSLSSSRTSSSWLPPRRWLRRCCRPSSEGLPAPPAQRPDPSSGTNVSPCGDQGALRGRASHRPPLHAGARDRTAAAAGRSGGDGASRPGTAAWSPHRCLGPAGAALYVGRGAMDRSAPAAGVPVVEAPPDHKPVTPWGAAADAGISVGRGSQKAAQATADGRRWAGRRVVGGADAGTSVGQARRRRPWRRPDSFRGSVGRSPAGSEPGRSPGAPADGDWTARL